MKAWEKEYLKKTNNPKVEVLTNNEMSSYNNTVIRLFEETDNSIETISFLIFILALWNGWNLHLEVFSLSKLFISSVFLILFIIKVISVNSPAIVALIPSFANIIVPRILCLIKHF